MPDKPPKWTPGPWKVERGNVGNLHPLFVVSPNAPLATAMSRYSLRPWCDEDAHLIAAAPELYDALQHAQDCIVLLTRAVLQGEALANYTAVLDLAESVGLEASAVLLKANPARRPTIPDTARYLWTDGRGNFSLQETLTCDQRVARDSIPQPGASTTPDTGTEAPTVSQPIRQLHDHPHCECRSCTEDRAKGVKLDG